MKYFLVRNDCRHSTYQTLAKDVTAIEPPIWMMLREQMLKKEGHEVKTIDTQVEDYNMYEVMCLISEMDPDHVELFPTGNHPSAYIQQRDDINMFLEHMNGKRHKTDVHYNLNFHPIGIKADWSSFDLTKYRAHNWHCDWGTLPRSPYAVVYTSISCPFHCDFCCVKEYYGETYKERGLEDVVSEISSLVESGVSNIKMMDEIFFFKKDRVEKLCDMLEFIGKDLNIWAYARIDTINQGILTKLRKSGFRWLCLGIESGNEAIRRTAQKGTFSNEKIKEVVKMIQDAGIKVVGNYIFGFPDDDMTTMKETFDLAMDLNCEFSNLYCMMAYPGSELHQVAIQNAWELPNKWSGYSQYSIDCHPVRTRHLTSQQVLTFRDKAFTDLYSDSHFQYMISEKFGHEAVNHINEMLKVKLRRRILEHV